MQYSKFRRIELGLTQKTLATRTGLSQPIISHIEAGRIVPSEREREAIARVLGCDPARLTTHVSADPLGDGAEARDSVRS